MIAMLLIQAASSLPSDVSALESVISALRSSIAALSSSAASLNSRAEFWEKWPYGFTAAVVIGVAMEWWVIRHDWREDNETWAATFFGLSRIIRPSRRKLVVEYFSVALVALGVAGELGVGIYINVINRHLRDENATLQSDSTQLVALVTQLAGTAAHSAVMADGAATLAQGHADAIGHELDAEIDREQVAERSLESEKQKRLKLAASLLPREVFDQSGIADRLSTLPSPSEVILVYPKGDSEAMAYAEQIAWVCWELRWKFVGRTLDEEYIRPGLSVVHGYKPPDISRNTDEIQKYPDEVKAGEWAAWRVRDEFRRDGATLAFINENKTHPSLSTQYVSGEDDEPPSVILIGVGPKKNLQLEEALRELGTPKVQPFETGTVFRGRASEDRTPIPLDPTFRPSEHP